MMQSNKAKSNLVTIFQPYVPDYRVPLFETLSSLLANHDLVLRVATPGVRGEQAARKDSASVPWQRSVENRVFGVLGHELSWRKTKTLADESAVVIAELASTNIDTYALALRLPRRLLLWGHGRNYVTAENRIDGYLERWLARRCAGVLVYTNGGQEHLTARGIDRHKIKVLQNSTDTTSLRAERQRLSHQDVQSFRVQIAPGSDNVGMFVGALDTSKRLDLLLEASAAVRSEMPDFRLVVAGDGPLREALAAATADRADVTLLPHADRRTLALLGAVADVCLMPGRVGLVAVDAMTLGLPVITTAWPFHAPEREYLEDRFSWVAPDDPRGYAGTVVRVLSDRAGLSQASNDAMEASFAFSVEQMAERMANAIVKVAGR